jgi:hypothetical protein
MQVILHRWQCHIDDGGIENNHEEPEADSSQPKGMKRPMLVIWLGRNLSFSEHPLLRLLCWLCKQMGKTPAQQAFRACQASALYPCHGCAAHGRAHVPGCGQRGMKHMSLLDGNSVHRLCAFFRCEEALLLVL